MPISLLSKALSLIASPDFMKSADRDAPALTKLGDAFGDRAALHAYQS